MVGPLTTLKVKSTICPCLTTPQEATTITAISVLSNLHIQFCGPSSKESKNTHKNVGTFVKSLLKNATNNAFAPSSSDDMTENRFIRGRIKVMDSVRGPVLLFEAENRYDSDVDNVNCDDDINKENTYNRKNISIPIKWIGRIESYDSFLSSSNLGIIIYKIGPKTESNSFNQGNKDELIRFNILSSNPFNDENSRIVGTEDRDDAIEQLNLLFDWNKERRKSQPSHEEDDDDNDEQRDNGLTGRALKAKYFIQKEIEMKKMIKDREGRKAKNMKDSGGLKYTALAMANREMT